MQLIKKRRKRFFFVVFFFPEQAILLSTVKHPNYKHFYWVLSVFFLVSLLNIIEKLSPSLFKGQLICSPPQSLSQGNTILRKCAVHFA